MFVSFEDFLRAGLAFSLTGFGSTGNLGGFGGFFGVATGLARVFAFDFVMAAELAIAGDNAAGGISTGGLVMSCSDALNTL